MIERGSLIYSGLPSWHIYKNAFYILISITIFLIVSLFFVINIIFIYGKGINIERDGFVLISIIIPLTFFLYADILTYIIPKFKIFKNGIILPLFSYNIFKIYNGLFIPKENIKEIYIKKHPETNNNTYIIKTKEGNNYPIALPYRYISKRESFKLENILLNYVKNNRHN